MRRVLTTMKREHDDGFAIRTEIDRVRKTCQNGSPDLVSDTRKCERIVDNPSHQDVDGFGKLDPKASATRFVPLPHFEDLVLGLRPKHD
jgi:hypothetical protein